MAVTETSASPHTQTGPAFLQRTCGALEGSLRRWRTSVLRHLPRGHTLDDDVWRSRHRTLTLVLAAHVPLLLVYGSQNVGLAHSALESLAVALFALAATQLRGRSMPSASTALGLVTCSAALVHVSGGLIEAHFHFFVVVALLTLYQDWLPFLLAVGFVVAHHGVLGTLAPQEVYNHPAAVERPIHWAVIHGLILLASAVASVTAWYFNEQHALQDSVTRLPNRRLFEDRASQALARRKRGDGAFAVLYIDLDRFKQVNDTIGHAGGDRLLALAAKRMSAATRHGDTVARVGGDEFAVLAEDLRGDADASLLAERLVTGLAAPFEFSGHDLTIGASVGIALSRPGVTLQDLLLEADTAMYTAKAAGRGRFEPQRNISQSSTANV